MVTGVVVNEVWLSLGAGSAVGGREKPWGRGCGSSSPVHRSARFAHRFLSLFFAISPRFLPFFSTAVPGPTLFWDNLQHWFDWFGEILPGFLWRSLQ